MKRKRYGFTVAEVLVTMAVLGVLATILVPTLRSTRPNEEMVMLKKVYYLAGRTVNELINDDQFYTEDEGFADTSRVDYHGQHPEGASKFCELFAARMNLRGASDCTAARSVADGGNFTTADGIVWSLPITTFNGADDARYDILVDVNGLRKGTNRTEFGGTQGAPDRFTISIDKFGRIYVPENGIEQDYLTSNDTTRTYHEFLRRRQH